MLYIYVITVCIFNILVTLLRVLLLHKQVYGTCVSVKYTQISGKIYFAAFHAMFIATLLFAHNSRCGDRFQH